MIVKSLSIAALVVCAALPVLGQKPSPRLLTPDNHTLILIDHQPQMAFAVGSIPITELRNNVNGLAKAAKVFNVPTILSSVAMKTFAGPLFPEVSSVFPGQPIIDRTTMNAWEDSRVVNEVKKTNRKKLVIAALWTEVCGVMPVLSAINEGYEVYIVVDASGGMTTEIHNAAVSRMVEAGATPITWMAYTLELQRDWARQSTYEGVNDIAKANGGGYGLGIIYARTMFGGKD